MKNYIRMDFTICAIGIWDGRDIVFALLFIYKITERYLWTALQGNEICISMMLRAVLAKN